MDVVKGHLRRTDPASTAPDSYTRGPMADSTPNSPIVTRFAPSPTGMLHVGGARTAMFAWAYAKGRSGTFLLRLEDTDLARSTEASAQAILEDLRWLGLDWDNADNIPRQSQRRALYDQHIKTLLASGQAYDDDGAVRFRVDDDITFHDEVFGDITVKAEQIEDFVIRKGEAGGKLPTFHFAVVVDDADMGVTDVIRGQEHLANTPKHVALQRALGLPTPRYAHLPSIMNPDGSKMSKRDKAKAARKAGNDRIGQSQSLGELLARCHEIAGFNIEPHHPVELSNFLEKKTEDSNWVQWIASALDLTLPEIDVADFRRSGYLPEVLCNYLALLGWSPTEQAVTDAGYEAERFGTTPLHFIRDHFSFDRVGKSNAKFDRDKLLKFSTEAVVELPEEEFRHRFRTHLTDFHAAAFERFLEDDAALVELCQAVQERAKTLEDAVDQAKFLVCDDDAIQYDPELKAVKKNIFKNDNAGLLILQAARDALANLEDWTGPKLIAILDDLVEQHNLNNIGGVAQPLRIALTGLPISPPIDHTLSLMGKPATLRRIDRCLEAMKPSATA